MFCAFAVTAQLLLGLQTSGEGSDGSFRENVFSTVYEENLWVDKESKSGTGSSLFSTEHLRPFLSKILRELEVSTFVDVPCGDFAWQPMIEGIEHVHYIGMDIVPRMIHDLKNKYPAAVYPNLEFHQLDLVSPDPTKIPKNVDVFMVRDVLFHMTMIDALDALCNVQDSGANFLLSTTYINGTNVVSPGVFFEKSYLDSLPEDIVQAPVDATGGWYMITLEEPPFSLPPPIVMFRNTQKPSPYLPYSHSPFHSHAWSDVLGLWKLPILTSRQCDRTLDTESRLGLDLSKTFDKRLFSPSLNLFSTVEELDSFEVSRDGSISIQGKLYDHENTQKKKIDLNHYKPESNQQQLSERQEL